ncbi:MAG: 50S ribosomal protein L1 [Candidatus Micrarchaeota archaeon]
MAFDKNSIGKAVHAALEAGRGKRKFTQSVDIAVNFGAVDFSKPENRINVEVPMPFACRKQKVAVFADGQTVTEAKAVADLVITSSEVASYASDKAKQAVLLEHATLATSQLMATVGKALGPVLSKRNRLPKPILPNSNLKDLVDRARRGVTVRSKGKNLPVVHCIVGKEDMPEEHIVENILAVLEAIFRKINESQVSSVFVKTTMGSAFKV